MGVFAGSRSRRAGGIALSASSKRLCSRRKRRRGEFFEKEDLEKSLSFFPLSI